MNTPLLSAIILILAIFVVPSIQMDYDTTMAFDMLRASSAAYCYKSELQGMKCGAICQDLKEFGYQFDQQFSYDISKSEAVSFSTFFNHDEGNFVVSFRGTQGSKQLMEELMQVAATSFDIHDVPNAVVSGYFYHKYVSFMRESFLTAVHKAAVEHPGYNFYIVGHSLGGAFATIGVLDAILSGFIHKDMTHLYTYGSPRVGDYHFANAVVKNVGQIYRVTHHKDVVPRVPPCKLDWKLNCQQTPDHHSDDGNILFHAWHVWPEVYYKGNTKTDFKICWDGEDLACSDQFSTIVSDLADHLMYMGISTECPHSQNS